MSIFGGFFLIKSTEFFDKFSGFYQFVFENFRRFTFFWQILERRGSAANGKHHHFYEISD